MSVILGINAYHAASSAALVVDGVPVSAIAEERLNRKKYYAGFPALAVRECLRIAGLQLRDVDAIAVGHDPAANLWQKATFALGSIASLPRFLRQRRRRSELADIKALLARECGVDPASLRFARYGVEHHLAHMASAYYCSSWDSAAGLTVDGSGDFVSCMFAKCEGGNIRIAHRVFTPHSLGLFYAMVCQFLGYGNYGDEGKVMGLAPLGSGACLDRLRSIISIKGSGLTCDPAYFAPLGSTDGLTIAADGTMIQQRLYSDAMTRDFGAPRTPEGALTRRDMDLAFGLQARFEEIYLHLCQSLHRLVPSERIVLSGGCALNSAANGKLLSATPFRRTWIQPASGDEGLSLGAALYVSNAVLREGRCWSMTDAYLGPAFSDGEIRRALDSSRVSYETLPRERLIQRVAQGLADGRVTGWFQGRMEWGPRALGNRSILAHPGLPGMKDTLNARIKHREWFRPFAPSVLEERAGEIFDLVGPSPFMMQICKVREEWRGRLCAVTHADNTSRVQTVARMENPLYYDLIKEFGERTGIPVVLNTSFNESEPIVCRPEEAIECYSRTNMDILVIGPFICEK